MQRKKHPRGCLSGFPSCHAKPLGSITSRKCVGRSPLPPCASPTPTAKVTGRIPGGGGVTARRFDASAAEAATADAASPWRFDAGGSLAAGARRRLCDLPPLLATAASPCGVALRRQPFDSSSIRSLSFTAAAEGALSRTDVQRGGAAAPSMAARCCSVSIRRIGGCFWELQRSLACYGYDQGI